MSLANKTTMGTRAFALDAVGNRTSTTINGTAYAYGVDAASNRLTPSTAPGTAQSYTTDAAGRITSDGTRLFTWTNAGQMATAAGPTGGAVYAYNGAGQRVKKVLGTGPTANARHYLYADDGVSLLGEYVQASPGAAPATLNEIVYLEGTPVLVMRANSVYYIQTDHLTTPRTIKDSAGAVVWRWESDAFGNGAANQSPSGGFVFEFNGRFPGQQFDAETGLHYNNARYYDPVIGRYISSDPIGLGGGINTYLYASAAPQNGADPTGESVNIAVGAGVGFVGNLGYQLWQHGGNTRCVDWTEALWWGAAGGSVAALLPEAVLLGGGMRTVTQWGAMGATSIRQGWVMTGSSSYRNWFMAGGPQLPYAISSTVTMRVPASTLSFPKGWEWAKGLIGQRMYSGAAVAAATTSEEARETRADCGCAR